MNLPHTQEQCVLLNILANLYLNPVTVTELQVLRDNPLVIDDPVIGPLWDEFSSLVSELVEDQNVNKSLTRLSDDHLSLFVGLGMPLAPPWGSVYLHDENLLMQETTYAIESFIEENRLKFQPDERQPIDHIGFCLQILAALLTRYMDSNDDTQKRPVASFLEQHLLTWSNRLLTLIQERADTPFYSLVSRLTQSVLHNVMKHFSVTQSSAKLHY